MKGGAWRQAGIVGHSARRDNDLAERSMVMHGSSKLSWTHLCSLMHYHARLLLLQQHSMPLNSVLQLCREYSSSIRRGVPPIFQHVPISLVSLTYVCRHLNIFKMRNRTEILGGNGRFAIWVKASHVLTAKLS